MKWQRKSHFWNVLRFSIFWWFCHIGQSKDVAEEKNGSIDEYDFIVVGGGSSGCIVASKLSESGNYSVLVIELGDVPNPGLDVPALLRNYHKTSGALKVYSSVPQKAAGLRDGGVIKYLVGHVLGGTAAVNGMMYNRGSPYDYDNWAEITRDPSWRYENLLEHFKNIEDYKGQFPSESQHGEGGPITVSQPKYLPGRDEWLQAGTFLGYPIADPNGPQKISFNPAEYSKKFGRRVSSYAGYIKPVLESRPYLKILTKSEVMRIQFEGNRATGVVYRNILKGGRITEQVAKARKEVIISAGVVGSAVLLMRSGIGPEDVLTSADIHPVKHLPVGLNFQDHTAVQLHFILNSRSQIFIPQRDLNPQSVAYYNQFGDGPYSAYVIQLQAFLASSVATQPPPQASAATVRNTSSPSSVWPDTHLMYGQTTMFTSSINKEELGAMPYEEIVPSSVIIGRPKSSGRVILNSTDPFNSDPLIDFNFYSHPDDLTVIMEGIQTTLKIFEKTPEYQLAGVRYPSVGISQCKNIPFRSDEYWRCYIRERTTTGLHGAGTCKMGRGEEDPTAVVDSKLRVIGVEGLRVVDTSIMPKLTNANIMAAAYVIAEKASAMILAQYDTLN